MFVPRGICRVCLVGLFCVTIPCIGIAQENMSTFYRDGGQQTWPRGSYSRYTSFSYDGYSARSSGGNNYTPGYEVYRTPGRREYYSRCAARWR
jgi:hypothetical protein